MKKEKRKTYHCGQRTVRLADCGSQSQAVFARRRSKSKLKLLDIREERKRRKKTEIMFETLLEDCLAAGLESTFQYLLSRQALRFF
ncbi:hypothetical protein TNCV_4501531 [Trichonephila clavipes]|nr:hypothetical protein TNCV_4501531 [Trichonephila clavipes]